MSQYTGSISKGPLTPAHNRRVDHEGRALTPETAPDNIDLSKTPGNVVIIDRHLPELYRETFGAALEEYNSKQVAKGHAERQISDYYEHILHSKQSNVAYEYVIQIGNMDEHPDKEVAEQIYRDWVADIQQRYGANFVVAQAIIHVDETTSHLHLEIVPRAESERGLSLQNSLNKAVEQAGYERLPKDDPEHKVRPYNRMLGDWDRMLTERMREHGIERVAGDKERQFGGVPIAAVRAASAYQEAREREADKLVQVAKVDAQGWQEAAEQAKDECRQEIRKAEATAAQAAQAQQAAQAAKAVEMQAKQATEMAKGVLVQTQQATEVAKGELGQIQQQAEQTQDRLECLRQGEAELAKEVDQLKEQVAEREHAIAAPDAGDDRQAAGQEQQEHERASDEQGHSIGEQVASLGREAAEAIQRAGSREGSDARGLGELGEARSAAEGRIAELESQRDAVAERVARLEPKLEAVEQRHGQAEQRHEEAERQNQLASSRLHELKERVGELRERVVARVTELRQQLGRERALEVARDVRDRVAHGREALREMLGNRAADRVNDALRPEPPSLADKMQEYSARDYARYAEQDRGMER